jgi:mannose-6-phosphate isomerase-like protein (cupin superfamily)
MNDPSGIGRLRMHDNYRRLCQLSWESHRRGRATSGLDQRDITLARLYSYAFRLHVIGTFHATGVAIDAAVVSSSLAHNAHARCHLTRARETLTDLANRSVDVITDDERALISSFYFYATHVQRAVESLDALCDQSICHELPTIRDRFVEHVEEITACNGIYLTTDTQVPLQGSFVVPNLGITIVPLVYGDHHSWNLAWLDEKQSDVPYHLHHEGVEIHLGYGPLHGYTVLGDARAEVTEGYAMPIPPQTRHGYTNIGSFAHHVPFVFGSQTWSGWGVFLDVEPSPLRLEQLPIKPVQSSSFPGTVHLEREIDLAAAKRHPVRYPIIPAKITARGRVGGLELSLSRITGRGSSLELDRYCAVSVVRGRGILRMAGEELEIAHHDHFGIPANVTAEVLALGEEPTVLLDTVLKQNERPCERNVSP